MNEKLESEVMISDKGVNIDLLTMNAGNILPNPYKGKNAISAPASILFPLIPQHYNLTLFISS